jgi:hypothetical protein
MGVSGQRHAPAALLPPGKGPPVPIVEIVIFTVYISTKKTFTVNVSWALQNGDVTQPLNQTRKLTESLW